jgi:hypothetical protein
MHVVPSAIRIVVVPIGVTVLLGRRNPPHSWTGTVGPFLPDFTIAPCVDSLLCYRPIMRPMPVLQDSPKIYGTCMHLYNCIWVVLLVPRLNLAFLSPKLSCGIYIVLVYLCPLDSIIVGILLGESYYNWHPYACRLFYLAYGPPTLLPQKVWRKWGLASYSAPKFIFCRAEREAMF